MTSSLHYVFTDHLDYEPQLCSTLLLCCAFRYILILPSVRCSRFSMGYKHIVFTFVAVKHSLMTLIFPSPLPNEVIHGFFSYAYPSTQTFNIAKTIRTVMELSASIGVCKCFSLHSFFAAKETTTTISSIKRYWALHDNQCSCTDKWTLLSTTTLTPLPLVSSHHSLNLWNVSQSPLNIENSIFLHALLARLFLSFSIFSIHHKFWKLPFPELSLSVQ